MQIFYSIIPRRVFELLMFHCRKQRFRRVWCFLSAILFVLGSGFSAYAQQQAPELMLFAQANESYKSADYKKAIQEYEQLVASGFDAIEIYFNLGNAYYKTGNTAAAILNYERAKRLAPSDDDIEFNLMLAQTKVIDKIDPAPQFFIVKWWKVFVGIATASTWSACALGLLWIVFACAVAFFYVKTGALKRILFVSAAVFMVCSAVLFVFAYQQYQAAYNNESAVVFAQSVPVKSEPQDEAKDLFVLHEGTKVDVLEFDGEWAKIRITDGSVGWLRKSTVQIV